MNQAGDWSLMVKSLIGETLAICLVEDDVVFFFFWEVEDDELRERYTYEVGFMVAIGVGFILYFLVF